MKKNIHKSLSTRFTWKRKKTSQAISKDIMLVNNNNNNIFSTLEAHFYSPLTSSLTSECFVLMMREFVEYNILLLQCCGWIDECWSKRWRFIHTYICREYVVKQSSYFKSLCRCKRHIFS